MVFDKRRCAALAAAVAVAAALLTACGSGQAATNAAGETVLRYQGWPNTVTLPELAAALGYFDGKIALKWVGNTTSGPQDIQALATGEIDVAGPTFAGAVAKLATSGAEITAVISAYGHDEKTFTGFYVRADSPIDSPKDLIGAKVGVNTLGGNNEGDIFTYLAQADLAEKFDQVSLVVLPPANIAKALREGQIDVGALHGEYRQRAVAQGGIRPLFTSPSLHGGPYNGGQFVFRDEFIAQYPEAVRAFTTGVAKAIEWARTTPRDKVIARMARIIKQRDRPNEDTSTLQYWHSYGVASPHGLISDKDFARWEEWLRATGAIDEPLNPSEFYTNKFNAFADAAASATNGK